MSNEISKEFKELKELKELDERNFIYGYIDKDDTRHRITLEDFYNSVATIKLDEIVPKDIATQFDVAKNLSVYSCFVYRFHQPAKMQAYSTLELALKDVFDMDGKKSEGLKWMLEKSLKSGLITKKSSTRDITTDEFSNILLDIVPYFRNTIAHGSQNLTNDSPEILKFCGNLINQIYENKELVKNLK